MFRKVGNFRTKMSWKLVGTSGSPPPQFDKYFLISVEIVNKR